MRSYSSRILVVSSVCIMLVNAGAAQQNSELVQERVVISGIRGSLGKALDIKRSTAGFVDSLVSEDIADFPDLNISEALQRVSGVSIERVEGEGQVITVRGLGPEFTRVTLNGQTVTAGVGGHSHGDVACATCAADAAAAEHNGGREVELDIFASELFSEVRIYKSPFAALTEGGLAATVDLRTPRPFDYDGYVAVVSAQGIYNDIRKEISPRLSAVIGNRWGEFGALVSVAYSDSRLRGDSAENNRFLSYDFANVPGNTVEGEFEFPGLPRSIIEIRDRKRLGVTASLQYAPEDSPIGFAIDVQYATFEEFRARHSIDGLTLRRGGSNSIIPIGPFTFVTGTPSSVPYATAGTFGNVSSRTENVFDDVRDTLFIANAEANWEGYNGWSAKGNVGYSTAEGIQDLFRVLYQFVGDFSYEQVDFNGAMVPTFSSAQFDFLNFDDYQFNQSRFLDYVTKDNDISAQIDVEKGFSSNSILDKVLFGVRYNQRTQNRSHNDGIINSGDVSSAPSLTDIGRINPYGFFEGQGPSSLIRNFPIIDFDLFSKPSEINPTGFMPAEEPLASYDIVESTIAGYVQLDFDGKFDNRHLRGNVGLRIFRTNQQVGGFRLVGGAANAVELTREYLELLPSLNVAFDLSDSIVLRLAASRAITRPDPESLAPAQQIFPTTLRITQGNPDLQPFRVNQVDLGAEWYFAPDSLLSATVFFKNLESFIIPETKNMLVPGLPAIFNDAEIDVSGEMFDVTQPVNGNGVDVLGLELAYQQPFSFLPAPYDGFGVLLNYTYIDTAFDITLLSGETRTVGFRESSKSSYNIVGYYEKGPFSGRLSYAWRDDYLRDIFSDVNRRNQFIRNRGSLDFSIQYDITENITLTFDAINILQAETILYGEILDRTSEYREDGRFILLGARAKF